MRARSSGRGPRWKPDRHAEPPPPPDSPEERRLVGQLTTAFVASDVDALVALLADDVRLEHAALPVKYIGRNAAARFYAIVWARDRAAEW